MILQNASSNPALCSIALPINTGMTLSVVLDRTEQEYTDRPNFPGSKRFS
jgi:hypothetical protein